jgi:hypothetical protein
MVRVPVSVPLTVGVKVTLIVQLAPAPRLDGQLLLSEKYSVAEMLEMVSAPVPTLVSVTDCAALVEPTAMLENVRVLVDREALEPVPLKVTVCGLLLALSVMVRVPLTVPVAVGVNVTLTVQAPPASMPVPQILVWEKPLLTAMLVKVSVALPEFVTVTD